MRMKPTTEFLLDIRRRWEQAASRKEQKKIIDEARAPFGYSYCHMTRMLKLGARKRKPSDEVIRRMAELEEYARKVYEFKARADFDQKTFMIVQAFEALRNDGQIPKDITLKSIRNAARRIGLVNEYKSPARKFQGRNKPLHLVQLDYSKSEYFRFRSNGQVYMQSPVSTKKTESRLYIAAAVDWVSRVAWFRYFDVAGESAGFVRDAMLKAFEEKPLFDESTGELLGHKKILQGIPREIYFDRGAGNMSKETASGLVKLGITKISGGVEIDSLGRRTNRSNKKARGMIEKFIGDFKRTFEGALWGRKLLGDMPPDFTLRELNEWAASYCEQINNKFHPVLTSERRWSLFEPCLKQAAFPPDEARMYFTGEIIRKVQRRLVQGKTRHDWFVVPQYINDGADVEVLFNGKDCFLFHDGAMVKLKPQSGSVREMVDAETGAELYDDFLLKQRLAEELDIASGGDVTVGRLPDSFNDDLKEFFEKPRTVSEIKEKAQYFIIAAQYEQKNTKVIPYRKV